MTKPTQAQIEAARNEYLNRCGHYKPPSDETFAAIISAAAEAGVKDDDGFTTGLYPEQKEAIAAAEVGTFEAGPDECDTGVALTKAIDAVIAEDDAAAEAVDDYKPIYDSPNNRVRAAVDATIERCAMVAENFQGHDSDDVRLFIAAAIRALKDKP